MHERSNNSGHGAQNVSGESSDNFADSQGLLKDLAERDDLDVDRIDGIDVAVEHNPDQSLVLLEGDAWSSAVAVDVSGLTLAEAIEIAPELGERLEFLAKGPVFAADGGRDA